MKLFYSPGACSLASHMVALETHTDLSLERVDTKTKRTESGRDFVALNPKGYVPALELDDGQVLTEGPVILQYLADRRPEAGLIPPASSFERYRLQEMLGHLNSELHKSYTPLFGPDTPSQLRAEKHATLKRRYAMLDDQLASSDYLLGRTFSVADAYLFTITNWAPHVKLDLSAFTKLQGFQQRVAQRPAVLAALAAEGLA
jgi:glutathione S-transferase